MVVKPKKIFFNASYSLWSYSTVINCFATVWMDVFISKSVFFRYHRVLLSLKNIQTVFFLLQERRGGNWTLFFFVLLLLEGGGCFVLLCGAFLVLPVFFGLMPFFFFFLLLGTTTSGCGRRVGAGMLRWRRHSDRDRLGRLFAVPEGSSGCIVGPRWRPRWWCWRTAVAWFGFLWTLVLWLLLLRPLLLLLLRAMLLFIVVVDWWVLGLNRRAGSAGSATNLAKKMAIQDLGLDEDHVTCCRPGMGALLTIRS